MIRISSPTFTVFLKAICAPAWFTRMVRVSSEKPPADPPKDADGDFQHDALSAPAVRLSHASVISNLSPCETRKVGSSMAKRALTST